MMILSACFFGLMAIAIRYASRQQHAFEIAFFRSLFGAVFALPLIWVRGTSVLVTDKLGFYVARCVIGMLGMMAGFWAIVHLPLAQAIALSYSSPLFVTIGAVLFSRRDCAHAALVGGRGGVHRRADHRPARRRRERRIDRGACRRDERHDDRQHQVPVALGAPDRIVLLTTLLWVPLSLPGALTVWRWPDAATWPWLVLSGFLGTGGHYFWTRALRLADASLLAPFSYVQLLIVTVLAWLLFDEKLDAYTATGAAIIIGATLYIARREAKLSRRHAVEAPAAGAEPQV